MPLKTMKPNQTRYPLLEQPTHPIHKSKTLLLTSIYSHTHTHQMKNFVTNRNFKYVILYDIL